MNQRPPDTPNTNLGLQARFAEGMVGGNAEFIPNSPQCHESEFLQPKWVATREQPRGIHPKEPVFRSRRWRVLVFASIALLCVGIGVGVGVGVGVTLGTRQGDSGTEAPSANTSVTTSPTTSVTTSPTASVTTSPTASAIPTSLNVLAAVHGNAIVTPEAKELLDAEGNMAFDSHPFPFKDHMFGSVKCFSLLHQLGSNGDEDMRIFHACEGTGLYKLESGPIEKSRNTQQVPEHGLEQNGFRIFSILWGTSELREKNVHEKVFRAGLNRDKVRFTNEFFGRTSAPGPSRGIPAGVVFYRSASDRPIRILYGLENRTTAFDFS
ncbi:hypothetical protein AJ78_02847 [Emergomyces pasteurianus Ep9510]|uniref:Uncharacterized protein n=1 Tax=Emergomyces pasteurianus Ep9510 TaxID=1447872 RepID=A0A1J9QMC6_9EURO|nr:hypothetical protein AJ78_02847 [Emergomyces pasteurianus Ep9510]